MMMTKFLQLMRSRKSKVQVLVKARESSTTSTERLLAGRLSGLKNLLEVNHVEPNGKKTVRSTGEEQS